MSVLMVGVDESTKGGMWTVVENYLNNKSFVQKNDLLYIPTSITGCSVLRKLWFTMKAYLKIIQAFNSIKFEITHVHMSERASIRRKRIVMDYAKRHGSKIVLHMHGAEFEVLYKQMNTSKQAFVRDTLNMADKIIILGEYWKEFIGSLVVDPSKVEVIYNAVRVPVKYEYDLESNTILFLGAVSKRKGIHNMLEALVKESENLSDVAKVKIYGPDVDGNIEDKIKKFRLQNWVKYCGWLSKEDKDKVLKNTAINVLPSYNEGLPMTILEAMSYGIPSITTTVAAIPEAVNNNNGILVEPGNVEELAAAIKKLVTDAPFRNLLSNHSYQDAVKKFSVEKHIEMIQKIYEELTK